MLCDRTHGGNKQRLGSTLRACQKEQEELFRIFPAEILFRIRRQENVTRPHFGSARRTYVKD